MFEKRYLKKIKVQTAIFSTKIFQTDFKPCRRTAVNHNRIIHEIIVSDRFKNNNHKKIILLLAV